MVAAQSCVTYLQSETLLLVPQKKKSVWSLGSFKPKVFSILGVWKSLQLSPPNSVMLSFFSRLSNWRVDKDLLGTQGIYSHWVQYCCGEL